MRRAGTTTILAALLSVSAIAAVAAESEEQEPARQWMQGIDAMQRLPITGLNLVQSGGRMLLVSENGKYVIIGGRLVDVWNNITIRDFADLERSARVNLKRIGVKIGDITTLNYGEGEQEVAVFVDPLCKACGELFEQIKALGSRYTFRLILLPVRGKESVAAARRLICSGDGSGAVDIMANQVWGEHSNETNECDAPQLARAIVTARVVGIKRVPTVIAPNGKVKGGMTTGLAKFLEDNRDE